MGADAAEEEQFGPYSVYERLGVGGMATVHRAIEHGMAERTVALKRLLPHLAEDASFIKSFVREAKLASVLHHVNIVQIYELGRVGTEYFISMEYIDGRDIRRILRHARRVTGPPPINITVGMLLQLCDALDYAHSKHDDDGQPMQLVHRDVSPSNVLVTSQGHLKVIDFGIARAQSSQLRTQTGRVKGKLAYMAPEAVSGSRELDARSDIWAIGVIAHELLTARPLFASKNEYQTLLKVQRGDIIPPSTFNQAVPPELDAIVARALERDADERYASAADMREDLMALRFRKGLSTSYRDIANWIEWAFSIEAPSGGFAATTSFEKTSGTGPKTPAPTKRDEEEAVEMAWGGGEQASGKPIVLDDVPDVSAKHSQQIPAQLDRDDIPSVAPQHDRVGTIGGVTPFDGEPRTNPSSGPLVIAEESVDVDLDATPIPAPIKKRSETIGVAVPPPSRTTPPAMRAARLSPPPATRPHSPSTPPLRPSGTITIPPITARPSSPSQPPATRPTPPPALRTTPPPIATARPSTPLPVERAPTSPGMDAPEPPTPDEPRTSGIGVPDQAVRTKPGLGEAVPLVGRSKPAPAIRTKPGVGEAAARAPLAPVTIGQSMVERELKPRRTWPWIVALLVAGGGAAGVVVYLSRDGKRAEPAPAPAPQKLVGTVKFLTEPADAEIRIGSMAPHKGSPWAIELPAGTHQIEVHRDGFKAWLSSVELAGGETNTITVALGPLGGVGSAAQDATLALGASTPGLEAVLDGQVLGVKTPIKMPLKTGAHTIILRKDGIEVWRTQIAAAAATDYTFDPAFTAAKQAFRAQQAKLPAPVVVAPHEDEAPTPQFEAPKHELPPQVPQSQLPKPVAIESAPKVELPKVEPPKPEPTPVPVPAPAPPVAPPVVASAPVLVAPSAVTKTAGEVPHLGVARNVDMPPVIAAKVCIDTDGKVTSAYTITKIEKHAAEDLGEVIKNTWHYAPYKQKGVAVPACFAVSFKTK